MVRVGREKKTERKRTNMKKILLVESSPRGSDSYSHQAARSIAALGFIGITDVEAVRVEGVAMNAVGPEKALASAREQSKRALAQLA